MTLAQTAAITKKLIAIFVITLVLSIIGFISYNVWHAYYIANLPPIEEKPDVKWGKLPLPDFPNSLVNSSNFSYALDTSTGNLPELGVDAGFDKFMKVYFITKSSASLLSAERSQNLASKFSINSPPQVLSDTKYLYAENNRKITVDLDTGNFLYTSEATISAKPTPDDDNKLVVDFETTLNNLGIKGEELKKGRTKIILLKSNGINFIPTTLRTETQAIQVSIWPENIDGKSIFTPEFNKALINALVSNNTTELDSYISMQYINYPIDLTTFSTYPIKQPTQAYDDLKSGKGVIILEPSKPQVSITSVYLGYFLSENYSAYLQPIYVFEGQNFAAYVPAITSEYLTQN